MDRAAFFDAVRSAPFAGKLTSPQVSGMERLLDAAPPLMPLDHVAYCLGTTFHETGLVINGKMVRTMMPVEEAGRGKGKPYGPTGFWGRGDVQLTHEENYRKATLRLRALGYLSPGQDMVRTPGLALDPRISAAVLFIGCTEGWFTGKKLSDYFGPGKADAINARRIVNGTDKASLVASYHMMFRAALQAAKYVPGGVAPSVPVPPVQTRPVPPIAPFPPTPPAPPGGLFAGILARLRAAYPPKV